VYSFLDVVDVDGESILTSSSCFLESLVVNFLATEACNSHVSWLIGQVLVTDFSRALSHNSIVEWFWLIELLSVLSSILIGVSVLLSGPAGTIPESGIHDIARAIINKRLSWAVQVSFVLDMLVDLNSSLSCELF